MEVQNCGVYCLSVGLRFSIPGGKMDRNTNSLHLKMGSTLEKKIPDMERIFLGSMLVFGDVVIQQDRRNITGNHLLFTLVVCSIDMVCFFLTPRVTFRIITYHLG